MINNTLGAPLGGTTRGGQYGLDWLALRLITPPNGAGWGGRYFPSMVVVALGEPGTPVICWALIVTATSRKNREAVVNLSRPRSLGSLFRTFMWFDALV